MGEVVRARSHVRVHADEGTRLMSHWLGLIGVCGAVLLRLHIQVHFHHHRQIVGDKRYDIRSLVDTLWFAYVFSCKLTNQVYL